MEYLHKAIDSIAADVKELKVMQIEQMKNDVIHMAILKEHERRSTMLEEQVKPLTEDFIYRSRLSSFLWGGSGVVCGLAALWAVVQFFLSK